MFGIKKIYIEKQLETSLLVQNVLKNATNANIEIEWIDNPKEIMFSSKHTDLFVKDTLIIHKHLGKFLSSCPGSDGVVCCQYFVINFGVGCVFDCHYCYLQYYMNQPYITIFGNIEDLLAELESKIANRSFPVRIGTGEYTDSLALDPLLELSPLLIRFFARQKNATLELKTKSANVDHIINEEHDQRTVIAWSINPPSVIEKIEKGTASLQERLRAARKAQEAGYKLAFHLDPIIYYENWEKEYTALLEELFSTVDTERIAWISLGTFRYSNGQKEIMQKRFPDDTLTKSEMLLGNDNKYRYYKKIRYEIYKKIKDFIQRVDPKLFSYMCMETQYMWEKVTGFVPSSPKILDRMFEERRKYMESIYTQRS